MPVEFRDYSMKVRAQMKDAAKRFLIEAAHEVTSQTIRTTPMKKTQLRDSWSNSVDESAMTAQIGSPLEESFWNEFGTGSHAIHGDGRKGWWVYIEGKLTDVRMVTAFQNNIWQTVVTVIVMVCLILIVISIVSVFVKFSNIKWRKKICQH